MKYYLFALPIFFHLINYAQYTTIPDTVFEQQLIIYGFDDILDGQVLTSNINIITELDICCVGISDLTGINDFTALVSLEIDSNNLSSIDISGLTNLVMLDCEDNTLSQIDLSANTNLMYLTCNDNLLSEIDLSGNLQLEQVWCNDNTLTAIDLSANTHLNELYCGNNPLNSLNIQNGNNHNLLEFRALNVNSNICIQVDDATLATAASIAPYNAWEVDPSAQFSNDCGTVSVNDILVQEISISPSLVKDFLQIKNLEIENLSKITVYDILGKEVLTSNKLKTTVSTLTDGIYFIKINIKNGQYIIRKIVKTNR
jgi:hypothetical protein